MEKRHGTAGPGEEIGFEFRFKRLNLCGPCFLLFKIISVSRLMGTGFPGGVS